MATMKPGFTIIRGARLADPALRRAEPTDVLIQDGVIREVGVGLAAPEGAEVVDAAGMVIHPGLINAHTHGHGGLARGQGDKWTLELLLAAGPWISGGRNLEDKKLSTLICAAEMVAKGCTAAYDLYYEFPLPSREGLDAVAEAYAEVGMRAVVAPMVADRTMYEAIPGLMEALPPGLQKDVEALRLRPAEETLAAMSGILKNWRWNAADIRAAVAPTIPHHCSDAFLCGCMKLAKDHGVGLHSHVGESKVQAITGIKRYGRTLLQHMDHLGLVDENFTAAHAIWLDDDDLKLMRDRGGALAHNPGSNMRLGNGMFRLRRALDLGVNVGIGTDGVNCSDNGNMYEALRYASMVSKVQSPDPRTWASVEEVYKAGTQGSARALGFTDVGAIAPGMKADIVFLDLNSLSWIPHNWTVNQIVHAEDATGVRHVMIGGDFVYYDRRHTKLDIAKLAAQAEAARARLEEASTAMRHLYDKLEPVVSSFCPGLAAQPYHLNRYLCDAPGSGV
ncbi:amidohydrolase family protein [Roseococcus thiosulfatophilus]|uniref:amidohydrolase family protein n=1 Tax=Roseococcus thiosulfatophilus TaxID=35813 RepID=UPI001A8FE27E|nr:amidohydrolase family protein [Roseococcus thiosulfatophilus]